MFKLKDMNTNLESVVKELGVEEAIKQLNEYKNGKPDYEGAKKWFKEEILDKLVVNGFLCDPKNVFWNVGDCLVLYVNFKLGVR